MKVAYLVNEYPKTTHSFIRREIAAIERHGIVVERVSIRPADARLAEAADRAESRRTRVILDLGAAALVTIALAVAVTRPVRFARALILAVKMGVRGDRGVLRHLAYLIEGCVLLRWCDAARVQHLHAHFGTNPAAVALLCRVLGGPAYSFTVHGPEEFERAAALSLAAKIAGSRFVVAVSDWGKAQLEAWRSPDGPPIHVVRCGVDETFLSAEVSPVPSAARLVSVGRLCEQKAPFVLLEAVHRLVDAGVRIELVLVGDGPLRAAVEARIAALGLASHVEVAGWADGAQVRKHLASARALVLASVAEGLPVVLMEAMASHRPVIATSVAGVPELVDASCGWLVAPRDVEALSAAMRAVLEATPERLAEMGRAGEARVRERHDVRHEAAQLAALFLEVERR